MHKLVKMVQINVRKDTHKRLKILRDNIDAKSIGATIEKLLNDNKYARIITSGAEES